MARVSAPLTDEQRKTIAIACLENAKFLLHDAEALIRASRLPSGTFILLVGLEEMLKARYTLYEAKESWEAWWFGFRDHKTKLGLLKSYAPDAPDDFVHVFKQLRERTLYVEASEAGDPLTPRGLIDPGELEAGKVLGWRLWVWEQCRVTLSELISGRVMLSSIGPALTP